MRAWLCAHASSSLAKFQQLEITGFHQPILFQAETPLRKFVAYIDPDDKFSIEDKLSQVSWPSSLITSRSFTFLYHYRSTLCNNCKTLPLMDSWRDDWNDTIFTFTRYGSTFIQEIYIILVALIKDLSKLMNRLKSLYLRR